MDDNIPLRVMLLLMDEIFDLKEKNQWLRRNIKNLLQQLIRATYGDTINRSDSRHTLPHTAALLLPQRGVNVHRAQRESSCVCDCRKIVDHVDYLTSPEQVADYVKKFR